METRTVSFELPLGVFTALRKTPEELQKDIRVIAAVKWYEMGQISQEKASVQTAFDAMCKDYQLVR